MFIVEELTVIAPKKPAVLKYEEITTKLKVHCSPAMPTITERQDLSFLRENRREEES